MRTDPTAPFAADRTRPLRLASIERCEADQSACPDRAACALDAERMTRARAGSRADFDALYDRYFAAFYRAASARLPSRALAEAYTRDLLEGAFCAPAQPRGCRAAHLLRVVKQIGKRGARSSG